VTPNDANEYQIEIYPTSQVFKKGHQIRLSIGTADTPATSPPLTALANETGTITLLHGPAYPSHVLLPVIGPPKPAAAGVKGAKAKKRESAKKRAGAKKRESAKKRASAMKKAKAKRRKKHASRPR
jgi:hypothetical protein